MLSCPVIKASLYTVTEICYKSCTHKLRDFSTHLAFTIIYICSIFENEPVQTRLRFAAHIYTKMDNDKDYKYTIWPLVPSETPKLVLKEGFA